MRYVWLCLAFCFSTSLYAQDCDPGEFGPDGEEPCLPCDFGRYQNLPGQDACLPCEPGTYQDLVGQTSCVDCEPGTFTANFESMVCATCPAGMTSAAGAESCTIIPAASSEGGGCGAITQVSQKSKHRTDVLFFLAGIFVLGVLMRGYFQRCRTRFALKKIK